jgi:L-serine deaminase
MKWFMNDELQHPKQQSRSLEQRMASRPQVLARFHSIADMMDQAIAEGCTADEAEARAIQEIQALGRELLGDWAEEKQTDSLKRAIVRHPEAGKHIKKK